MIAPADLAAIARDVVQETCLNFPIIPGSISQRHHVFLSAGTVKKMCETAITHLIDEVIDEQDPALAQFQHDVADLLLHSALVVEYAADFLAKHSPTWITSESMSVLDKLEEVKGMLNGIAPGDTAKVDTHKTVLLNAVASDLQIDSGAVTQFIDSSFQRHSVGSQEAEDFIKRNPNWDRYDHSNIANLTTFMEKNSVSILALRSKHAQIFLNILEQAARSDSIATPDEKRRYQTYLRRLSCRSGLLPSTFYLRNVKPIPCTLKPCDHCSQGKPLPGPVLSFEGGFGTVRLAEWKKPGATWFRGKAAKVAIKKLKLPDRATFCHEAAFWHYLDADKVVPFYGVARFKKKNSPESCLVSQWMNGGPICCYVDNKEDSIRFNLLRQAADGIKYLHDLNFVHCDIKPGNILIDTRGSLPKALIMDFGFSNAARVTNVAYSTPCGFTRGYVGDNFNHWDPDNDVYAFGVTCCQVVLVNKRRGIASIPEDIENCVTVFNQPSVPEDSDGRGSKDSRQEIIRSLYQKFFPDKKPDSPFVHEVFRLAAFTCSTPRCNMDYVVDFFKSESSSPTAATSSLPHEAPRRPSEKISHPPSSSMSPTPPETPPDWLHILEYGNEFKSAVDNITQACPTFRILILGRSGVGKSNLINAIFKTSLVTVEHGRKAGASDIEIEFKSSQNDRLILHDSQGLSHGSGENLNIVKDFIKTRSRKPDLKDRLHAIWLCSTVPTYGGSLLDVGDEEILQLKDCGVPIVVVFTKYDVFLESLKPQDEEDFCGGDLEEDDMDFYTGTPVDPKLLLLAKNKLREMIKPFKMMLYGFPRVTVSVRPELSDTLYELEDMTLQCINNSQGILWVSTQEQSVAPKIKASIDVVKQRYPNRLRLLIGLNRSENSLVNWFETIHSDVVKVWGIHDPMNVLITSTTKDMYKLQQSLLEGRSKDLRGMMGYIADITIVLHRLYFLIQAHAQVSGSRSAVDERLFKLALGAYKHGSASEHSLKYVHHEIESFVMPKNAFSKSKRVIEEVERLINVHQFKPSEYFMVDTMEL